MLDRVIQAPLRLESGKVRTNFLAANRMSLFLLPQEEQLSTAGADAQWGSGHPQDNYAYDGEHKQEHNYDDEERTDDADCHGRHAGTQRHGADENDRSVRLAYPRQAAELGIKSILKVKSQEDSLKSAGTKEHSRRRRRQSSSYGRMMAKLQKIRSKSSRSLMLDQERQERNDALCATCHSREPSTLSEQEAFFQQQEEERAEHGLDQDHAVNDVLSTLHHEQQLLLRRVSFSTVGFCKYQLTLHDHPRFPSGTATIGLSWIFDELPTRDVDEYEQEKQNNKASTSAATDAKLVAKEVMTTTATTASGSGEEQTSADEARLSLAQRQRLLEELGLPQHEVKSYLDSMETSRKQRLRAKAAQQRRLRCPKSLSSRRQKRRLQKIGRSTTSSVRCDPCREEGGRQRQGAGQASRENGSHAANTMPSSSSQQQPHHSFGLLKPWTRAQRQGWEGRGRFQTWLPNWLSIASARAQQ